MRGALIYWVVAVLLGAATAASAWLHIGPGLAILVSLAVAMPGWRLVAAT